MLLPAPGIPCPQEPTSHFYKAHFPKRASPPGLWEMCEGRLSRNWKVQQVFTIGGLTIVASPGGLHSVPTKPKLYLAQPTRRLHQFDVQSANASCVCKVTKLLEQQRVPVSVPSEWLNDAIRLRNALKADNNPLHHTLKVMNNSYYGKICSPKSRLYCPAVQVSII